MLNKKSRLYNLLILPSISIIILAGFLLTFSVNAFAAGSDSGSYFPMEQNVNDVIDPWILTYIESNYDITNNYFLVYGPTYISNYEQYHFIICPKSDTFGLYGEVSSNGYQWSLYKIGSGSYQKREVKIQKPQYWYWDNEDYGFNWQNLNSNLYVSNIDYISNFKILSNNTDNASVVLKYGADDPNYDINVTGHAVPYDPLNLPTYETGHSNGSVYHKPWSWSSYNWNTYTAPQFDDSSIINGIESIGDILTYSYGYLKDNISGSINNLGSNLISSFSNIENDLQYTGDLIVNGLNNGFLNLYNNFVSLLEPITIPFLSIIAMGTDPETGLFSVPYLTQVLLSPDPASLVDVLIEHDTWDILTVTFQVMTKVPNLFNQLLAQTPTPRFHIPSLIYHGQQIGDFDVDFSWYAAYKVYVDIILNAFLIFGYAYWLFVSFGSHLRGHFMEAEPNNPDSNARLFRG